MTSRLPSSAMRSWALALLGSLLLLNLPFGGIILYPFKLLATWMHELSHAAVMIATGAGFNRMLIYPDSSGMAYASRSASGVAGALIAAAGYMGTPVVGAFLLVVTTTAQRARVALLLIGAALLGSAWIFIDNAFGRGAMQACGAAFVVVAVVAPARLRLAALQFVAAQACVNALLDIRVLFRPTQVVGGKKAMESDAHAMAAATFGTTDSWAVWFWGIAWLAWSLLVLYVAIRLATRAQPPSLGEREHRTPNL